MHTAAHIRSDQYCAELDGSPASAATLLDWGVSDRLGVVVTSPFGALGAGMLVSLATASYFDVPERRRRKRNLYPEIYLFHVGQRWGSHSAFDFWPEGKEVMTADAVETLRAINFHAVTHLVVPDGPGAAVQHRYREPEIARDRIKQCYAYSPNGQTEAADVTIATTDPSVIWNFEAVLKPEIWVSEMESAVVSDPGLRADKPEAVDYRRVISYMKERWNEVDRNSDTYAEFARISPKPRRKVHFPNRIGGST